MTKRAKCNFIQFNLHHTKLAQDCLMKDILALDSKTKGPVVALVQEPYLGKRGHPIGLMRPTDCQVGAKNARAAIIATKAEMRLCPDLSDRDTTTCQLSNDGRIIHLFPTIWMERSLFQQF